MIYQISSACSITALTVQRRIILFCSKKQLQNFTENNIFCSNNENPQIKATSSVYEAPLEMSTWIFSATVLPH